MLHLDWARAQKPSFLFLVADFLWGRYHNSLTEKYTTCPSDFGAMVLFVPGFVHDLHILSHVLQCRIIHILMTTVPQFKAPVYYVLKSLFLVHDGDVWGLWIRDTLKTPILIMHMNKNIICHLLCRSMKKLYQVLYTYFFFWVIKRKKIYLYYTACEQKRALWVADAHFPPLSLSFCLWLSVFLSLYLISFCPLSLHSRALLHYVSCNRSPLFVFQNHNQHVFMLKWRRSCMRSHSEHML